MKTLIALGTVSRETRAQVPRCLTAAQITADKTGAAPGKCLTPRACKFVQASETSTYVIPCS